MSHAFKLAVAQSTLRRSLKSDDRKDKKDKKKSKTPWEVLKRTDKKQSHDSLSPNPATKRSVSPTPPSRDVKAKNRKSNYLNPPPPVAPGYSPEPERRVASSGKRERDRERDRDREREREGGREREREREGGRERERAGGREGERERGREGGREKERGCCCYHGCIPL